MQIEIPVGDKTVFTLTPEIGSLIREAIVQQIDVSFRSYLKQRTGLEETNVSSMLAGKRNMTIGMLRRLLSGTRIEVELCTLNFTLENTTGGIVQTADSPTLEEMLSLREQSDSEEMEHHLETQEELDKQEKIATFGLKFGMTNPPTLPTPSSSSEKPQGRLKTLLASRSWENQDESSDSSSEE